MEEYLLVRELFLQGVLDKPELDAVHQEDCDSLFLKSIEDPNSNINICSLAPFLSEEALSSFVDKYIEGEYQDVNIDILYPFLKSSDIKKLFKYVVNKE